MKSVSSATNMKTMFMAANEAVRVSDNSSTQCLSSPMFVPSLACGSISGGAIPMGGALYWKAAKEK